MHAAPATAAPAPAAVGPAHAGHNAGAAEGQYPDEEELTLEDLAPDVRPAQRSRPPVASRVVAVQVC